MCVKFIMCCVSSLLHVDLSYARTCAIKHLWHTGHALNKQTHYKCTLSNRQPYVAHHANKLITSARLPLNTCGTPDMYQTNKLAR